MRRLDEIVFEVEDGRQIPAIALFRTARKAHRCVGNLHRSPACNGGIEPGESYVEYLGETPSFQSGDRYCQPCALMQGFRLREGKSC